MFRRDKQHYSHSSASISDVSGAVEAEVGNETGSGLESGNRLRIAFYYLRLVVVALILAFLVKAFVLEAYNIPSESMRNTLLVGDFVLAEKITFGPRIPFTNLRLPAIDNPEVGDVVVFKSPEDPERSFIKRVVAQGGDKVQIVDKVVLINGNRVDDSGYAIHSDTALLPRTAAYPRDNFGPITVPKNQYFVMGDNRDNSSDSRFWGCVSRESITGRAILIHWSWKPDKNAPQVSLGNPLSLLRSAVYHIRSFPDHVRWGRVFTKID